MMINSTPFQLEALAHEQINRRVARRDRRAPQPARRHERLALLLRRFAERLDPIERSQPAADRRHFRLVSDS